MSWPLNAECPRCFRITSWHSRYAREENRCKCDGEIDAAERAELDPKELPNGRFQVAA